MLATSADALLAFVALLGASVWVGGFVAIVVAVRVARNQLDSPTQIAFFRALGRAYLPVGASALVLALAAGAGLLAGRPRDGTALAAILVAAALVTVLVAGVIQARGMTRLRARAQLALTDELLSARVRRGAVRAGVLRGAIGLLSVVLLGLAAVLSV